MIDPNEAPEGFVAVDVKRSCEGCSFVDTSCPSISCLRSSRKDGESVIFIPREKSNLAESGDELAEARAEIERWKSSHDHVCRKFADCENARDENARLCEEARDEAARYKAGFLEQKELIAKLKAQLTTALDAIARMR